MDNRYQKLYLYQNDIANRSDSDWDFFLPDSDQDHPSLVAATVDQRERKFSLEYRVAIYTRGQVPNGRQRAAVTERARRRPLKGRCGP